MLPTLVSAATSPLLAVEPMPVYRSELVAALSYALDLTEGQPLGHNIRSCLIGMRLGQLIGLSIATLEDLYYALLLKDTGCSSNSARLCQILGGDEIQAKREVKTVDWTRLGWDSLNYTWRHVLPGKPLQERLGRMAEIVRKRVPQQREVVKIRCERGAQIVRRMGFSEATAAAIRSLDEHWDGKGYPEGRQGDEIPLLSRVINLSQTMEVFATVHGLGAVRQMLRQRRGRWFDPELVQVAEALCNHDQFWQELRGEQSQVSAVAGAAHIQDRPVTEAQLDNICEAFAEVIDAKSPYTYQHSSRVAAVTLSIAQALQIDPPTKRTLRRAALLHDIGKLGIPNLILEKPGKLEPEEWLIVRRHPYYSQKILEHVTGFADLAEIAGAHHEKLDGSGYWRGLVGAQLSLPARVLAVADCYDALAAKRPYRNAIPPMQVIRILGTDVPRVLDGACVEALQSSASGLEALALAMGM